MKLFSEIYIHVLIFIIGEILAIIIFHFIAKSFKKGITWQSIGRGLLERAFLFICLVNALPQALILFGALKIGTRLKNSQENPISNDYFLTGNLTSALFAVIYYLLTMKVILL